MYFQIGVARLAANFDLKGELVIVRDDVKVILGIVGAVEQVPAAFYVRGLPGLGFAVSRPGHPSFVDSGDQVVAIHQR